MKYVKAGLVAINGIMAMLNLLIGVYPIAVMNLAVALFIYHAWEV